MEKESSKFDNTLASQEILFRLLEIERSFLAVKGELERVKQENKRLKEKNLEAVLRMKKENYSNFVADIASKFKGSEEKKQQLEQMIKKITKLIHELRKE